MADKKIEVGTEIEGKICLVTASSRGIGFHVARGLAMKGAFVVLASHNRRRGDKARRRINGFTLQNSSDFMLVDLSSQEEIRKFARDFKEQYGHLDVLVNNAGGFFLNRRESVDGIEMTFALNHLNYFMTTLLLADSLLAVDSARIVNVASESHRGEEMDFDDLQLEQDYSGTQAYGQSKLANLLFTYELADRLANTGVTVNALHPGFVDINLGSQNELVRMVMSLVHFLFAKSAKEGAETPIYLASSPVVENVTGKYFIDKEPARSSEESYDLEARRKLWEVSEEMCELEASETGLSAAGSMPDDSTAELTAK